MHWGIDCRIQTVNLYLNCALVCKCRSQNTVTDLENTSCFLQMSVNAKIVYLHLHLYTVSIHPRSSCTQYLYVLNAKIFDSDFRFRPNIKSILLHPKLVFIYFFFVNKFVRKSKNTYFPWHSMRFNCQAMCTVCITMLLYKNKFIHTTVSAHINDLCLRIFHVHVAFGANVTMLYATYYIKIL